MTRSCAPTQGYRPPREGLLSPVWDAGLGLPPHKPPRQPRRPPRRPACSGAALMRPAPAGAAGRGGGEGAVASQPGASSHGQARWIIPAPPTMKRPVARRDGQVQVGSRSLAGAPLAAGRGRRATIPSPAGGVGTAGGRGATRGRGGNFWDARGLTLPSLAHALNCRFW